MTTPSRKTLRTLMLLLGLVALAACSSTVVRTPSGTPAPRVSTPKPGASVVVLRGDTL